MEKALKFMLSLMLISASFTLPVMKAETAIDIELFPKPQYIKVDGTIAWEGSIDIVVHGTQESATLPKLQMILDAQGFRYEVKTSITEGNNTILLCNDGGTCDACEVNDEANALSQTQGYVLEVSDKMIKIIGSDGDGVYYGVMSLKQLFDQKVDGQIAKVEVSDYPDVKFRGYIEGFYGIPWSHEDRMELFEDTTWYKMTTYIYAPKDDPYHRDQWRTLYPAKEEAELKQLCEKADENNMEFCWTIHPGADYNYNRVSDGDGMSDDFETLIAKFEQVYSMGVRQFGIFYDDLDYNVANGRQHASVINSAYDYMLNKYGDVKPMITVVTRYTNSWGQSWSGYFTPFMQDVHEDTLVLWTGQDTMSAITKNYMEYPKTMTGIQRDFGVWWNYPVNDYKNSNMFMAPLDCLHNDVDNIATFFLNPMSEADASRVAIYSGADYAWNIEAFDSKNSWQRAIEELVPEASEAFARFADNISYLDKGNGFFFDESIYLKADIASFKTAQGDALLDEAQNMKNHFAQMIDDVNVLKEIENRKLYDEIQYHLNAYLNIAEAGYATMSAYEAALKGDLSTCLKQTPLIQTKLNESRTHRIPILNGSAQVELCTYRLLPFIEEQASKVNDVLSQNMGKRRPASFITNHSDLEKDILLQGQYYVVEALNTDLNAGEYVGVKLPCVMNLRSVQVQNAPLEACCLQYSLNGIVWYDMPSQYVDEAMQSDFIVTTAYVRLLAEADMELSNVNLKVEEWIERSSVGDAQASISTSFETYQNYKIENAIDGNMSTWFWSSTGSNEGDMISVDLSKAVKLEEVVLYSGINKDGVVDGFDATQLQISLNGIQWTNVGTPLSINAYQNVDGTMKKLVFNAQGITARYFRFVAVGSSNSWSKVYEITYMAKEIASEADCSLTTNKEVIDGSLPAMLDGDMSTAVTLNDNGVKGDYIQLDLDKIEAMRDVSIYFGNDGTKVLGFSETTLQTSLDGKTWKDINIVKGASYTQKDGLYQVNFTSNGSLVRFLRFSANQDYNNALKVHEIVFNTTSIDATASVSTNMGTYNGESIANAMDGNLSTKYYSNSGSSIGSYIQVDLGKEVSVYDAKVYFGGNPNVAGSVDGFATTKLQASSDGQKWQDVGDAISSQSYRLEDGKYTVKFVSDGISARYLRFSASEASENWVQVYEIEINEAMDDNVVRYADEQADGAAAFYPNEDYINGSSVSIAYSNLLDDGNIQSGPALYDVKANDALVYPMSVITNVKMLTIIQNGNKLSNAKVSVLDVSGQWHHVGVLDEAFKDFEIKTRLLAMKIVFDGQVQPEIYEIIVTENDDYISADYTAVEAAMALVPSDLSIYTVESVTYLNEVIAAVVYGLSESEQAMVDAMAQAIIEAIEQLEENEAYQIPSVVENLSVKQDSYKAVTLTWDQVKGATSYDVYRQNYKDDADYEFIQSVDTTQMSVSGLMTGKTYSFFVIAKNSVGSGAPNEPVSIATTLTGDVSLAIEPVGKAHFKLSWNAIDGATRYIIYRKRNNDKMKKVLTLGSNDLEYTTAELPHGDYQFVVKAGRYDSIDRVMTGASNTVKGSVEKVNPSISLTAGSKSIKVSWEKIAGVTNYEVYRATSKAGKYTKLKTTTSTSYTAKSLTSGKTYYFKVRGYKTYKSGTDIQYKVYTDDSEVKSTKAK